jgi:hypothetical protein
MNITPHLPCQYFLPAGSMKSPCFNDPEILAQYMGGGA